MLEIQVSSVDTRTFEFNRRSKHTDTGMVTDVIIIEGGKTPLIDEKLHTA